MTAMKLLLIYCNRLSKRHLMAIMEVFVFNFFSFFKNKTSASFFVLVSFLSNQLMAGTSGGMPWETPMQKLADSLTGPVVRFGAVIAVAVTGMLWYFAASGFARTALSLVFGLAVALSAANIVDSLFGVGMGLVIP